MAKLYFRYGAMGSSKTANAIMVQYNYQERGQKALMLKPQLDKRDGLRVVGSRAGLHTECSYVEEMDSLPLSDYDCIIVDEAQFLTKPQVERLVHIVDDMGIPVICYGLRTDFQGNLFEGSQWLLAWADSRYFWAATKVTSRCAANIGQTASSRRIRARPEQIKSIVYNSREVTQLAARRIYLCNIFLHRRITLPKNCSTR